ncbi:MAG: lipoprotein [Phycisphaerae bacterium]|nr:MAG: lipoprotein [Phycisphaerae bacterium]
MFVITTNNPSSDPARLFVWALSVSLIAVAATGCTRVPETGRHQVILMSKEHEKCLGLKAFKKFMRNAKPSEDQRFSALVERVGQRVALAANQSEYDWEFKLVESSKTNAFCLPGGKIVVYTGIVPIMANEAGMAVLLGHEVAHAVARHGAERLTQQSGVNLAGQAFVWSIPGGTVFTQLAVNSAFGVGSEVGFLLPYSRTHELEADHLGLVYAAQAGYDPREAIGFWQRMRAARGDHSAEFLSTHPIKSRRIQALEEFMHRAVEAYHQAPQKHGLGLSWSKQRNGEHFEIASPAAVARRMD